MSDLHTSYCLRTPYEVGYTDFGPKSQCSSFLFLSFIFFFCRLRSNVCRSWSFFVCCNSGTFGLWNRLNLNWYFNTWCLIIFMGILYLFRFCHRRSLSPFWFIRHSYLLTWVKRLTYQGITRSMTKSVITFRYQVFVCELQG